jgi:hypothetical protein
MDPPAAEIASEAVPRREDSSGERVRPDSKALGGMTFGVPAEHQDQLVSAGGGRAAAMFAQRVLGGPDVHQRFGSRGFEIGDRLRFRCDLTRGLESTGSLELRGTIANELRDHGVARIALLCGGKYRAPQCLADIVAKVLFGGDDVGRALSHRPAVGSGFIVPLRFGFHIGNGIYWIPHNIA